MPESFRLCVYFQLYAVLCLFGIVLFVRFLCVICQTPYSGGYCGGVPPLPIPNREVKPACADGTAMQCGRVGGRHLFQGSPFTGSGERAFFVYRPCLPAFVSRGLLCGDGNSPVKFVLIIVQFELCALLRTLFLGGKAFFSYLCNVKSQ